MQRCSMRAGYPEPPARMKIPLYVHVPFCESLCPFCPFHRILLDEALADDYFTVLEGQLEQLAAIGYDFNELCVGGGTPTTRPLALVKFIRHARALWKLERITVETNPNHLQAAILDQLRLAGVTRLSVGVQSLHDHHLKHLGRLETYGDRDRILPALAATQGLFDTFNVDMIFNLPGQTIAELDEELVLLKSIGADQISYHPLMPSEDVLRGNSDFGKVDFRQEQAMYRRIIAALGPEYRMGSVWCFHRKPEPGEEYFVEASNYLGIGSGAFSLIRDCFHATDFDIGRYMSACRSGGSAIVTSQPLSGPIRHACRVLTRMFATRIAVDQMRDLRLSMGILRLLGWVRLSSGYYELTAQGNYRWLVFMRRFFMNVNHYRQQLRQGLQAPCPFTPARVLWRWCIG